MEALAFHGDRKGVAIATKSEVVIVTPGSSPVRVPATGVTFLGFAGDALVVGTATSV